MLAVLRSFFFLPAGDSPRRGKPIRPVASSVAPVREDVPHGFARITLPDEPLLVQGLRRGDHAAYDKIFLAYYAALAGYGATLTHDTAAAEDLAQDVLFRLWDNRESLTLRHSLGGYLFGAIRNAALNRLRDNTRHRLRGEKWTAERHDNVLTHIPVEFDDPALEISTRIGLIEEIAARLPARCYEVFMLRWRHGMRYAQIATTMGISVKTVETQLMLAIKAIRRAAGRTNL